MKYVLVIGDGMADNPVEELGGLTPLQYAKITNIDALTAKGELHEVKTCPEGLPAGSDTGILSIFGVDPCKTYTGRSPLEAAATGIQLAPGEASYRCNMVTYEDAAIPFAEKRILSHSAGSIEGEESKALVEALFADPDFAAAADAVGMRVYPSLSFRHIAVQKDAELGGIVLEPPHNYLGQPIGPILPSGNENAKALLRLMELAHNFLDRHPLNESRRKAGKLPANGVWFWAEGSAIILSSFVEKYKKEGTVISAVPLCHGIANLLGLKVRLVEGATGELDTNYEGKYEAALDALRAGDDFVCVHLEAPDECTHNGDLKGKLEAIEGLDVRIVAPMVKAMEAEGMDFRMLILADHKTLTSTRGHDGTPVPFLLYDSTVDTGLGLTYSEENGAKGTSYDPACDILMPLLFGQ